MISIYRTVSRHSKLQKCKLRKRYFEFINILNLINHINYYNFIWILINKEKIFFIRLHKKYTQQRIKIVKKTFANLRRTFVTV